MKNNLRILLAKQKKTIADIHEGTRLSKSTLTAFYYERTKPNGETLLKIADYLGVTLDELVRVNQ
ncbi:MULTISPECIES: helix-turn-helix transcriptional regulator [unclassified Facklamia]|uniref:helix-turn-helix domain-containing protein n=1 Tax=Aerococcaceae TaxID=186827 RepID=UPI0013BC61F2|nr:MULTISPECIES: helix-turn-helix transcriptional regulator [unclassified Facklamia]NEW64029.1 helix-turn-helix domain-containing protein [Facklamia sp. 252]NEW68820.1 helix-turn-helix domain-containing protein [Facklamia sp. 253]QQD65374.1 helix-turn-helix transcriptional regulator [Aerococcaceae bacterium zg-252]